MRRGRQAWVVLALLTLNGGCSILPERKPSPALHDFGPVATTSEMSQGVSVSAPDWLMSDRIFYRLSFEDPTHVRSYNLDRWLAPPPQLLTQSLHLRTDAKVSVHIRLLNFEQIFERPETARVFMRLRISTDNPQDPDQGRERDFRFTQACPTADAKGAVAAFSRLIPKVQNDLQNWLNQPR